jgi:hypothetical protein
MLVALIFCLFMGVTAIAMGLGAAFPALNRIAQPFVCPDGDMTSVGRRYNPYPGRTVITRSWYCVDARTHARTRLDMFPLALYAGSIYGLGLFVPLAVVIVLRRPKRRAACY